MTAAVEDWNCPACNGSGKADPNCAECEGRGWIDDPIVGGTMTCPVCDNEECETCKGSGERSE